MIWDWQKNKFTNDLRINAGALPTELWWQSPYFVNIFVRGCQSEATTISSRLARDHTQIALQPMKRQPGELDATFYHHNIILIIYLIDYTIGIP